ncbi:unnamed protein product [Dibothriocephalus latus]|uniref:Uncharacterized protein n=1 Tax=Dibothriocephalus latus TaxID=60516 RepID=A0A3P7PB25_DIBLA|nr:unnamed protein product [Dibothriocephalus latus]
MPQPFISAVDMLAKLRLQPSGGFLGFRAYTFGLKSRCAILFASCQSPTLTVLNHPRADVVDNIMLVADFWFPRPLVASRDSIGEEGTFIAFCPHVMHADCKEKARPSNMYFKCPVCHALSNFDLPLYGHVTDGLSSVWLSRQLEVHQNSYDLTSWLKRLQRWIDERPLVAPPGSSKDRQLCLLPNESEPDGTPIIANVLWEGYLVISSFPHLMHAEFGVRSAGEEEGRSHS